MFALNLDNDSRILSATYDKYASEGMTLVDSLPSNEHTTDVTEFLYVDGEYVYSPKPVPIPEPTDTELLLELAADHEFRISELELFGGI